MILDVFYTMFKGDASQLKQASAEVQNENDKTEKSFKKTDEATKQLEKSFGRLGKSIVQAAAAFVSIRTVIGGLKGAYSDALELGRTSQALNVNIETLDAWGKAVAKNGGSAQTFQQSLRGLANHLNITNASALNLLPRLANIFQRAGTNRAMRFGQNIGLDQSTIMTLQQGRREVEALIARQKELGVVTQRDAEIAKSFNNTWQETSQSFKGMWQAVLSDVLPGLESIIKFFKPAVDYLRQHSDFVVGVLKTIGAAAAAAAVGFVVMNAAIIAPIAALVALIGFFALLYDDVRNFEKGNDSLIGRMLAQWPIVGKVIRGVFDGIKASIDYVIKAFNAVKSFLNGSNLPHVEPVFEFIKEADANPISSQTSNSILNNANSLTNRNVSVQTGDITINTQATDAEGIQGHFIKSMEDQFRQAMGGYANGAVA